MLPSNTDIGQKLKIARQLKSLSQQAVGTALGVSFQQVQKYENGINRISVESMLCLKDKLGINLLEVLATNESRIMDQETTTRELAKQESALLKSFREIKNPHLQRKVLSLVKAMTNED